MIINKRTKKNVSKRAFILGDTETGDLIRLRNGNHYIVTDNDCDNGFISLVNIGTGQLVDFSIKDECVKILAPTLEYDEEDVQQWVY